MSLIFIAVLCWAGLIMALAFRHARTLRALWREPMLAQPVLIVESDDWGPGPESDAAMLRRIADLLGSIQDADGRPAVMTLGVVLGSPDGPAILADDCARYHRRSLEEQDYSAIVKVMRDGCAAGIFSLQRHGLEHCWPDSLLARARADEAVRAWLADPATRSEALPSELQSRWVDAGALPSRALSEAAIIETVCEERDVYCHLFGSAPVVAVPNTFVWTDAVERAWAATGVSVVVTCGRRYEGRAADGGLAPATREIRNGERGADGVLYVVRDAYFEPMRGHRAEQAWRALSEHAALGRPTLLETHRENFVSSPECAEGALRELERALSGARSRHADIHFISTADLAMELSKGDSGLLLHGAGARTLVFLRRLRATQSLSRGLKLCGLYHVLPPVERLLARVTPFARA